MDTITTAAPNNALRKRMLQDMTMRGFGEHTQKDYIRHVRSFAVFLGRSPDTATIEDLRRLQMDQHKRAISPATINGAVSALRFLFSITLKRPEMALGLVVVRCTPKLREVLSVEGAARLIEAAPGIKYKAALSVAYGAGLRVSEVTHLKITDIDSTRMLIRVEQGIRRFLIHILPRGFHRIRHYGLLASSTHKDAMALARKLLGVAAPIEEPEPEEPPDHRPPCPCCGGHMTIIEAFARWCQPRAPPQSAASIRENTL
jgi:site-specific recombinase XerD